MRFTMMPGMLTILFVSFAFSVSVATSWEPLVPREKKKSCICLGKLFSCCGPEVPRRWRQLSISRKAYVKLCVRLQELHDEKSQVFDDLICLLNADNFPLPLKIFERYLTHHEQYTHHIHNAFSRRKPLSDAALSAVHRAILTAVVGPMLLSALSVDLRNDLSYETLTTFLDEIVVQNDGTEGVYHFKIYNRIDWMKADWLRELA